MKKQILIIKHGALGDIVQAFDSFYSIRVNFKDHKITLLTSIFLFLYLSLAAHPTHPLERAKSLPKE